MSVVKPYKKVANNGNLTDKEPITITLDTLDGASDVNLTEVEISDSVTSTGTNVVTGKGVYNAINALHTQVAVETSSSINLNGISYLKAPAITAVQLKQLATAFMEQKTAYIHYTPVGGVQHYYKIEAGNTKTVETVEYSEIHIHGDIDNENATNPGDSLCVELIYQCTDGATVEVTSNPYFIPANSVKNYTGVTAKLPAIDANYISPTAYKLGKYGVPIKILYNASTINGDISFIDVLNCGYRSEEGEIKGTSRAAGYYITFSWNDNIYNIIKKDDNTLVAEIASITKVSQLANDSGYLTTETDPTVPLWAKAATKPTYTAAEVHALPDTTSIPTETTVSNWGFTKNKGTVISVNNNTADANGNVTITLPVFTFDSATGTLNIS